MVGLKEISLAVLAVYSTTAVALVDIMTFKRDPDVLING